VVVLPAVHLIKLEVAAVLVRGMAMEVMEVHITEVAAAGAEREEMVALLHTLLVEVAVVYTMAETIMGIKVAVVAVVHLREVLAY
jgi:hypothetical protein